MLPVPREGGEGVSSAGNSLGDLGARSVLPCRRGAVTYSEGCKTRSDAGMVELSSLPNLEIPARKLQEPVERPSRSVVVKRCSHDGVELQMHHKRMKRSGTDGHIDRRGRTDGSRDDASPSAEGLRRHGVKCWAVRSVRAQK